MKIDKDTLVQAAKKRQTTESKTRLNNRDLDRKEKVNISNQIERIQVDTSVRTSGAVKKGLDKLSNTMTTASDALSTIRDNLTSIRGIIDASLKGTLADNNSGQTQINDLVAGIKSVIDGTTFRGEKIFGGSFSYNVYSDANLQRISGDLTNTQTGTVNPPAGSGTGGLVCQNTSINNTDGFSPVDFDQTKITSNDQYLV
jgi:flagellin-like hook-associated protein FlgL